MAWLRIGFLVALVAAGMAGVAWYGVPSEHEAAALVGRALPWSAVAAALSGTFLGVVLFPRAAFVVLIGLLFGPVVGTLCAMAGQLLGSGTAFTLARLLGRDAVGDSIADPGGRWRERLARADRWLGGHGLSAVIWARLVPIVPYGLVNYGFGVSQVRPAVFVLGTAIGILPSTIAYATLGGNAGDPTSPMFLGAAAFTALSVLVAFLLRRLFATGKPAEQAGAPEAP